MTTLRAILFDLGDTILEFGSVRTTALFVQGARASHAYLKGLRQPVAGPLLYGLRNLAGLRLKRLGSSLTGRDFDSLDLLRRIGVRQGIQLTDEQWQEYAWLWYEPLARTATVEPDLIQTLTSLQERHLALGILSNTFVHGTSLDRHLRQLGLLEFFPTRIYSYEFPFRKPHTEIFRIAANRIGCPPEQILYVGDRIDKDILPALAVGMRAALKTAYTNTGKPVPKAAWQIDRMAELPGIVEQIESARKVPCTCA